MLWTLAVILLAVWGLGMAASFTMGGYIHVLLVLAAITVLIHMARRQGAAP